MMMMIYFNSATDTAVPFTHKRPNTEAEKIMKYVTWPWKSKTSGSLTKYIHLRHLRGRSGQSKLPKISTEYRFNIKTSYRGGQKAVPLPVCHIIRKFLWHAPWPYEIGWTIFTWLSLIQQTIWERWRFPSRQMLTSVVKMMMMMMNDDITTTTTTTTIKLTETADWIHLEHIMVEWWALLITYWVFRFHRSCW